MLKATLTNIGFELNTQEVIEKRFDPKTGAEIEPYITTQIDSIKIGNKIIPQKQISEFIYRFQENKVHVISSAYSVVGIDDEVFPETTAIGVVLGKIGRNDSIEQLKSIEDKDSIKQVLLEHFGYAGKLSAYLMNVIS